MDETKTHTLLINQGNFKIGITGSTALQIGFQSYGIQKETDFGSGSDARSTDLAFGGQKFLFRRIIPSLKKFNHYTE